MDADVGWADDLGDAPGAEEVRRRMKGLTSARATVEWTYLRAGLFRPKRVKTESDQLEIELEVSGYEAGTRHVWRDGES